MVEGQAEIYRQCQEQAAKEFMNSTRTESLWSFTEGCLNSKQNEISELQKGDRVNNTAARPNVPLEEYWMSPPKTQRVGEFTVDNKTYPAADKECGADEPAPEAMQKPLEKWDQSGHEKQVGTGNSTTKTVTSYYMTQLLVFHFTSSSTFSFASVKKDAVRIEDGPLKPATEDEVKTLPNGTDCGSCQQETISRADMDKAAVAPPKEASEQGKLVIGLVESEEKTISVSGKISFEAELKIEETLVATFGSSPLPDVGKTQAGDAGAKEEAKDNPKKKPGRCLHKRRKATAKH